MKIEYLLSGVDENFGFTREVVSLFQQDIKDNSTITFIASCDADVIYADFMKSNPGSGKVMAKSGMTFEGYLRGRVLDKDGNRNDLGMYSITKEEYFNQK